MKLQKSDRRRPQSLNAVAAEIAAAVLVHVAFWLLVLSMLSMRLAPWAVAVLALLPVLLYFIARIPGAGKLTPVYALFLPLLAGLAGAKFFAGGFEQLFNYFAKAMNEVHGLALFPFGDGYPASDLADLPTTGAVLLGAFLMAGLFAYAICRKKKAVAVPATVLPALLGFLCGLRPTMPAFVFYLVAVTFYLILLQTRSKGTARRLTWLNGEVSGALLIFLVLLSLLLSGFERSDHVEELRQQIAGKVTAFRYAPDEEVDGQPGGDLTQAHSLRYTDRTVLTIETPNAFSMYLRGFSGDVLENGKWETLPAKAYFEDYSLTGPWVRSSYFDPAISLGQLLDLKWQVQTTQYEDGERDAVTLPRYPVTIRNELAFRDRVYAPYEVSGESKGIRQADLSQEGIFSNGLRGKRSYELIVYQPQTKDYGNVSGKALIGEDAPYNSMYEDAFVPTEKVYRAFVSANELDVPEEYDEALGALSRTVVGSWQKESDAVLRIRSYFASNFTYSLDTEAPEAGKDPLLVFLNETRTGYDAHFATLAVLLLREAGIPARYAEGYFVSEELAASVPKETDVTLHVPDSASHAWVELYKNGVGWVPVEMTPGYFESESGPSQAGTTAGETTVQPEEVPEETSDPDDTGDEDSGGTEEEEAPPENEAQSRGKALLLLPVLLLLLLIPLVWNRSVRKRIEAADSPEAVALAYRYMMRIFRLDRLEPEEHRPKALAPLLGDEKDRYLRAVDLIYKETYSAGGLSDSERAEVADTVLDLTADRRLLRRARKEKNKNQTTNREAHHGK